MSRKTFEEIVALWQDDKRLYVKKSTYCAYSLIVINHLLPAFSGSEFPTQEKVQAWALAKLESGLSRKSVMDILMVLKMVVRFAVRQGYMTSREIDVRFPTEMKRTRIEVLDRRDHKSILDYLRRNLTFMNLGIYLCLGTGMRIGEVCALMWEDIDVEMGTISVLRTIQRVYVTDEGKRYTEVIVGSPKSRTSIREIPLSKDLITLLKPLKRIGRDGSYVLSNSSHPVEPRTYRNYYNRLMAQLNMSKMKFHGLRHTFATRCIESRCDYKTVSILLGHSDVSTTLNLYVHPTMDQKRKCVEQMCRSLK